MIPFRQIASRLYGRPLLLLPTTAQTIEGFVRCRIRSGRMDDGASNERSAETIEAFQPTPAAGGGMEIHGARSSRFVGSTPTDASGRPLPFRRTPDGVAVITIIGELVNRGAWVGASSGLVSYEGINHQLSCAAADPQTRSIMLDIESPGGEAVGAFECAAMVRKAATVKPVIAVVNGMACSAGYAIASGATRIITTPTGLSGSIGVVMVHLDYSQLLAGAGIQPTFIFAGDHKVDGNPYEPLPASVRADFQREIDASYSLFLESVAAGRGVRLTAQKARATQARVLMGEAAVKAGLADTVMTFDEAIVFAGRAASGLSISPAQSQGKGVSMMNPAAEGPLVLLAKQQAAQSLGAPAQAAPLRQDAPPIVREAHRAAAAQLAARGQVAAEPARPSGIVAAARRSAAETLRARDDGR